MARIRTIKPGFFLDDELAELPYAARLLFAGLWCLADREGRLEDRPKRIKAEVLPYDDEDVDALLTALAEAGFVQRYEVDGTRYIQVVNFAKHQKPNHREAASTIPPPDGNGPHPFPGTPGHARERQGTRDNPSRACPGGTGREQEQEGKGTVGEYPRDRSRVLTARACAREATQTSPPLRHTPPPDKPTFNPHKREPTPDEIRTHAAMVGYPQIDAEAFIAHYRAVGWMRGSTPITDWRPLVSRWREVEKSKPKGGSNGRSNGKRRDAGSGARGRRRTDYDDVVEGPYDDDGDLPGDLPTK